MRKELRIVYGSSWEQYHNRKEKHSIGMRSFYKSIKSGGADIRQTGNLWTASCLTLPPARIFFVEKNKAKTAPSGVSKNSPLTVLTVRVLRKKISRKNYESQRTRSLFFIRLRGTSTSCLVISTQNEEADHQTRCLLSRHCERHNRFATFWS